MSADSVTILTPRADLTLDATPCDQHTFYYAGAATSVLVSGDFNGWASTAPGGVYTMTDVGGTWSVTQQIGSGRHLYKLIVDVQWIADPSGTPDFGQ